MLRCLALLLLALPAAAQKDPLAGLYTVSGTNPGGTGAYGGTLEIEPTGDAYRLIWQTGAPVVGVGIRRGAFLAAAYGDAACGVALYTRGANNTFVGAWAGMGGTQTGTELIAAPETDGRSVVMGTNPGGGLYRGHVALERTGDTFVMRWAVGDASYTGIGVRLGDAIAVGYGPSGCGVAFYSVRPNGLAGVWALQGQHAAGTEQAVRN